MGRAARSRVSGKPLPGGLDAVEGTAPTAAHRLASYLLDKGIDGVGPLSGAAGLAATYLEDVSYASNDARVAALIRREMARNFTTGFVTGLGGVLTLPVSVPGALAASWVLQARMAAAIARIYGHDPAASRTRTAILLSLAGDVAKGALEGLPLTFGTRLTQRALDQVPGRALVEINKRIGARLLVRAGSRRIASFPRLVPFIGGLVGGTMDAMVCRVVGQTARRLLHRPDGVIIEGEVVPR
jgi:hypothetical protein